MYRLLVYFVRFESLGGSLCHFANCKNSILLHSGLNPAWHFWLSTRFSCCLKMKSVENILGYIREQFYRFSRGCKPRENLWNCSRKYPKMFETYFIFRQQKIEFKPMSGVIMLLCNRMFCCIFGWLFWAQKKTTSPKKTTSSKTTTSPKKNTSTKRPNVRKRPQVLRRPHV